MKSLLYSLSRTSLGALLLGWILAHFSFMIPADRLYESDALVAFEHPTPSYPIHILIMPKGRYRNLFDLPVESNEFLQQLIEAVRALVTQFELVEVGYRLILNGGANQEVDLLHFHLVGGEQKPMSSSSAS